MSFRFLHLADLHVETVFGGRPETRERLLGATREALQAAVEFALDEKLDAVLIAGDAFDDDRLSQADPELLMEQLRRLSEAGIHVFYATGNHDPGAKSAQAAQLGFSDPEDAVGPEGGLYIFKRSTPKYITIQNQKGEPLAVIAGAGHIKADVDTNLAAKFKRPTDSIPVVGLLHTQVEATSISSEHANYAPSLRQNYEDAGFDYWALGHVHKRQQPFEDLPVWYSGNLQGRNPKETGRKGGLLVTLRHQEEPEVTFVPFAPVEWHLVPMPELGEVRDRNSLLAAFELAGQGLEQGSRLTTSDLCVRFAPSGECPMSGLLRDRHSREELEEELQTETGFLEVQIRPQNITAVRDLSDVENTPSVHLEALNMIRAAAEDDSLLLELAPTHLPGMAESASTREIKLAYLKQRLQGLEEEFLSRGFSSETWS